MQNRITESSRLSERSDCGSGGCVTCPFSFNEESEYAQNTGCLPTWWEAVELKEKTGQNWGCHSQDGVLCGGFARHLAEKRPDLDIKKGGIISYDLWAREGQEVAVYAARQQGKFDPITALTEINKHFNREADKLKAKNLPMQELLIEEQPYKILIELAMKVAQNASLRRTDYFTQNVVNQQKEAYKHVSTT